MASHITILYLLGVLSNLPPPQTFLRQVVVLLNLLKSKILRPQIISAYDRAAHTERPGEEVAVHIVHKENIQNACLKSKGHLLPFLAKGLSTSVTEYSGRHKLEQEI